LRWPMMVACSLAGLFGSAPSIAHDWYPLDCCSNIDCHALVESKGETVTEVPEGWRLWDGRFIGRDRARPSPDGQFHLCETLSKSILCFFVPPGSS
jgi:hypothetical protein